MPVLLPIEPPDSELYTGTFFKKYAVPALMPAAGFGVDDDDALYPFSPTFFIIVG